MATKPLVKNGVRITLKSKSNGKPGRPKGTRKKRQFEETKLGFLLKYEAPIEYELIMSSTPRSVFPEPKIKVIEAITLASPSPVFQKNKFFRYLEEYRKNKLCCERAKILTPKRKDFYERMQMNQIKKYIDSKKKDGYYY